jgi:hypothetical protein
MAKPINPTTLVGLKCWLRPGVGVETTAGAVTTWRDQSGNGKDLPALGASNTRPAYQSDAGDGRPAVFFDGINDYLGPANEVITSAGKAYTAIVTARAHAANPAGAQPFAVGGGNFNGGGSPDLYIGIDQTTGQTQCIPEDDGANNNTNLNLFYGTSEFQTLAFRQDYYGPPQNFFEWSEDFSNVAWQKLLGATVQQDVTDSPDGFVHGAVVSRGSVAQSFTLPSPAVARGFDASVWVKADRRLPAPDMNANADGIGIPYDASINLGSGSFVIAFWYKSTNNVAGTHIMASFNDGATYTTGWLFNNFGGDLDVYVQTGPPVFAVAGIFTDLGWHRIVLVGDANAGTVTLYIDGAINTLAIVSWNFTTNQPLRIGWDPIFGQAARGMYRDLVICKGSVPGFVVPTLPIIQEDYARTGDFSGISARYPMDEGTGTSVFASVGGGGAGTFHGSPFWSTSTNIRVVIGGENWLKWSTDLTNLSVWTVNAMTIAANVAPNPLDGTTDAFAMVEDGSNSAHFVDQTAVGIGIGTHVTQSVFVKPAGRTWFIIGGNGGGSAAWFNLVGQGVVGTVAGISATVRFMGGGWYFLTFTYASSTIDELAVFYSATGDAFAGYVGTNTLISHYIWNPQIAKSDVPGPPIRTGATQEKNGINYYDTTAEADWVRIEDGIFITSGTSQLGFSVECKDVGDEIQLYGAQATRSGYPVDYTKTTSAPIGLDTALEVGTYPNGVTFSNGLDGSVNDNSPYTSQNTTGRSFSLASLPVWDGAEVIAAYTGFKGWVRDVLFFDRSLSDDELAGVNAFLLAAPEDAPPTVSNVAPTPGSAIARVDPVFFDVTDDQGSLRLVLVAARFADGSYEVVHDGTDFAAGYATLSTREAITNGFRYRVRRAAGWPSGPTIVPFVVDTSGQENA